MLLDLVNRISSERKVEKVLDIQVWLLWRSSRGRPENALGTSRINLPGTSFARHIKASLDVISGCPQDVRWGHPRDGQIGSLGDILGTLEASVLGTSWGSIFAGWVVPLLSGWRFEEEPNMLEIYVILLLKYPFWHFIVTSKVYIYIYIYICNILTIS